MASLNYSRRLNNLRDRKFDRELNESNFSKSASAANLPENVKYLVESMRPIGQKYNDKTNEAGVRVKNHLEGKFELHFDRAYRNQGSVQTKTNIKVHSDFDLLTIIDKYHYPEFLVGEAYKDSDPNMDIKSLREQATAIMKQTYDEVNVDGEKGISIFNKALNRKVDIVFCFWYHSKKYQETSDEYYKGIYLYNFKKNIKIKDFPFAAVHNINVKGEATSDGSRRGIRLLKNLRADSESNIANLKSFQLTSIVHQIDNGNLIYSQGNELQVASAVSNEMSILISDSSYRKSVKCPKGTETPLADDNVVPDLVSLKQDLDTLINDTSHELTRSFIVKKAVMEY